MKKLLPILFFILSFTSTSFGQARMASNGLGPIARIYPNPATTFITFDMAKGGEKSFSVQIFSFLGKKMTEVNNINKLVKVDLSSFNRGVYIFQVYDSRGKMVESGKFSVSR